MRRKLEETLAGLSLLKQSYREIYPTRNSSEDQLFLSFIVCFCLCCCCCCFSCLLPIINFFFVAFIDVYISDQSSSQAPGQQRVCDTTLSFSLVLFLLLTDVFFLFLFFYFPKDCGELTQQDHRNHRQS